MAQACESCSKSFDYMNISMNEMEHIRVFAVEIYFLLQPIIKKNCARWCKGCRIRSSHQSEHDVCIKLTKEEMVELCFYEALREIDINRSISLLKRLIPINVESYIFTEQWNRDIIQNPLWQEKVKEKVDHLQESEL